MITRYLCCYGDKKSRGASPLTARFFPACATQIACTPPPCPARLVLEHRRVIQRSPVPSTTECRFATVNQREIRKNLQPLHFKEGPVVNGSESCEGPQQPLQQWVVEDLPTQQVCGGAQASARAFQEMSASIKCKITQYFRREVCLSGLQQSCRGRNTRYGNALTNFTYGRTGRGAQRFA